MKPSFYFLGLSLLLFICSCSSPALITSSWHRRDALPKQYDNVFVAAITHELNEKQAIENKVQADLQRQGITVEKSMDVFPPKFTKRGPEAQNVQMSQIAATGAKGLLIITIARRDKETRFEALPVWEPTGIDYMISHPADFDGFSDEKFDFNGFYKDLDVYVVETRFYDTQTKKLVWGAESKTYAPHNINGLANGYGDRIYSKMLKDGLMLAKN